MPLQLNKLQELLINQGFIPNKYFIMDGTIMYIELFSINTAELFFLYIPSKYTFELDKGDDVFKISYLNISVADDMADDHLEKNDITDNYNKINLDSGKIEEFLLDQYRTPIIIKDVSDEDNTNIKVVYRQIQRLRYSVLNIKYKVGILYKNYFCTVRRDDTIDCFSIKHYPRNDTKRLVIITDLEVLYEKGESLIEELKMVKDSIYSVLMKNQGVHSEIMGKLYRNQRDIINIPKQAEIKQLQYDLLFSEYKKVLDTISANEQKVLESIAQNQEGTGGIHTDINRAHNQGKLEKELDDIRNKKNEIAKNMVLVKQKKENTILNIDTIMFNNTVMFDAMIKNFAKLKEYV